MSDKIARVETGKYVPGDDLPIRVELLRQRGVDHVVIAYRSFGEDTYKRIETSLAANFASAMIPAKDIHPPFLEYYVIMYGEHDLYETYPLENPTTNPLHMNLVDTEAPRQEIVILSPDRNERVTAHDLLISFSLLRVDPDVRKEATRLFLDQTDVTRSAVSSGDLVVFHPQAAGIDVTPGSHTVRADLYDSSGTLLSSTSWGFIISTMVEGMKPLQATTGWVYGGSVQLETRNESVADATTPFNRATLSARGRYDQYAIRGRIYLTNEEKDNRQPQNRYYLAAESPWLKLAYGDQNPVFPNFIMNGRRVRGFTGNLELGSFNLDMALGDVVRHIESEVITTFPADSLFAEQQRDNTAGYGIVNPLATPQLWGKFRYGTYSRDILVIRPSFGSGNGSHVGFSFLRSRDDPGSIRFGIKPEENMVLGSDLRIILDNRNVEFLGEVALSATNKDISSGTFSDADIDSIFKEPDYGESTRDNARRVRDILSRFITVNEHLIPLNLSNTPTLAYSGALLLNYFNNAFRFSYLRHGNNYESFGQPFLRTDIRGFNISDRLRLMDNQLALSGGYERLQDNTAETKGPTTTFSTVNTSVGYYPRINLPGVTIGYLRSISDNEIPGDSLHSISEITSRFTIQISHGFNLGGRHMLSLNVSTSSRDDATPLNRDTRNTMLGVSNATSYSIPLQTLISVSINASRFIEAGNSNQQTLTWAYTAFFGHAEYRLAEERLRLSGTVSPTFGDLERTLIDAGIQYYFLSNLSAQTQLRLFLNRNATNDVMWTMMLRFDI